MNRLNLKYSKVLLFILIFVINSSFLIFANPIELTIKFTDETLHPLENVQVKILPHASIYVSNSRGEINIKAEFQNQFKIIASKIGYIDIDTIIYPTKDLNTIFLNFIMSSRLYRSGGIIVTATRTEKEIQGVPLPISIVNFSEVNKLSIRNLDEILNEFTSLPLIDDHGRGVQIQGLDPDYTLILINGEPLINRTGGIFDISRFYVGNANRIEIVRGPNSSIYGSNALAGVINILTSEPIHSTELTMSGKYSSHNSIDIGINLSQIPIQDFFTNSLYYNFFRTDGFKLIPTSIGKTIPEIYNHTFQVENYFYLTSRSKVKFSIRGSFENESNQYLNNSTFGDTIESNNRLQDINSFLSYRNTISSNFNYEFRVYYSYFSTKTTDQILSTNNLFDEYKFSQNLLKNEFQGNYLFAKTNYSTFGIGFQTETAKSLRIKGGKQKNYQLYFYIQDDYYPFEKLNIIGSLRFDRHSDYTSQISPKLAGSYNLNNNLILKASLGTGFKAPSFEELYLDWTNPLAGYTVFGSMNAIEGIQRLQQNGQIASYLISLDSVPQLKPEKSFSFDFGGSINLENILLFNVNFFRNNVYNLIDFLPIAFKTNGQRVHTYKNFNRIFTQGIELSSKVNFLKYFALNISYQFLLSGDLDVIEKIKTKKIFKRDQNGFDYTVQLSEYGGLFHRPIHSGNIRIIYDNDILGFYFSLRVIFKSKYGFKDLNGNGILDDAKEYAPGYSLTNINLSKTISKLISLNLSIDNIFDKKDVRFLVANSGRTISFTINFNYVKP